MCWCPFNVLFRNSKSTVHNGAFPFEYPALFTNHHTFLKLLNVVNFTYAYYLNSMQRLENFDLLGLHALDPNNHTIVDLGESYKGVGIDLASFVVSFSQPPRKGL